MLFQVHRDGLRRVSVTLTQVHTDRGWRRCSGGGLSDGQESRDLRGGLEVQTKVIGDCLK